MVNCVVFVHQSLSELETCNTIPVTVGKTLYGDESQN